MAWAQLGQKDFQKHVVVFIRDGERDNLPTLLVKMSPWTESEIDTLKELFFGPSSKGELTFLLIEDPLHPEDSFLDPAFYSGTFPDRLNDSLAYRCSPSTDEQPFFGFLRKGIKILDHKKEVFLTSATAGILNSQLKKGIIPMDIVHLVTTGIAALLFSCIFIFVPLAYSKTGKTPWPYKAETLIYFSCLGAGFIIFELVFIQIFMKLIGFPLYVFQQ